MIAEEENLTQELTQDGKLILEPGYLGYLRGMGYQIDSLEDIDTVESDSDPEKSYLVAEVETFDKPQDHPRLDYVADKLTLRVCSCWSWRNKSADLTDGENPSECGTCKHLKQWKREERAEADEKQVTL
jgi:hypothetical protein